jgi:Raf kinase inhibitor-like YbhB/YbcL family protein
MMCRFLTMVLLALLALPACASPRFTLSSPALPAGGTNPEEFTCDGADVSPPLQWQGLPAGTKSLALIVHDPDAPGGDFVHWMAVGIPAEPGALAQGATGRAPLVEGRNDFGSIGYRGPCPPPGKPHRYVFELVALEEAPGLAPGFSREQLDQALAGHELGRARFTSTFGRQP